MPVYRHPLFFELTGYYYTGHRRCKGFYLLQRLL